MSLFFPCFQHSFGETLIFSLKGWGSWDCSLFPSFSLKSPFPVKMCWQILSRVPWFAKWYMLLSTTKCLHIRLCRSFLVLFAYSYTTVWKIKHVQAYCCDLALEQWSCCSEFNTEWWYPASWKSHLQIFHRAFVSVTEALWISLSQELLLGAAGWDLHLFLEVTGFWSSELADLSSLKLSQGYFSFVSTA